MTKPILEVTGIKKNYGRLEALKGVSFSVGEGELFGLLGPNGAGKSTLVSIISCLVSASAGSATLDGRPLRMNDASIRRQIGLVPQDLALYGELTARENLLFFGRLYGVGDKELEERADKVLDAIALTDRAEDRVSTYSGGMKRRLNLGAAIMHEPKLLILDEPTTGVDPQSRNRIFEEVIRLNSIGMTVIYISHYMEEVQRLCPRIGILDHGELIACDTVAHLLRLLQGQIMFRLRDVPSDLAKRLQGIDGATVHPSKDDQFILRSADVPATLLRLATVFAEMHIEPARIEVHEPDLERVFLHLTGRALRD